MAKPEIIKYYPPKEERINVLSHALGLGLSVIGTIALVFKAFTFHTLSHSLSFIVFGASLILLYAASTFYHSAKLDKRRHRLNVLDHASIYVLIAGTYTPYSVVSLPNDIGMIILSVIWIVALIGVILKLFYAGKYQVFSTIMYVLMGCIMLLVAKPLGQNLSSEGLNLLYLGGVSYIVGAIIFSINKLKFNHAIFHFFVLGGSICHFFSIYYYVN